MNKSTRIRLIQQIRDAMNSMPWDDTDLILEVYGFGAMPEGPDGFTLVQWLQNGSDAELLALGHHLDVRHSCGQWAARRTSNKRIASGRGFEQSLN